MSLGPKPRVPPLDLALWQLNRELFEKTNASSSQIKFSFVQKLIQKKSLLFCSKVSVLLYEFEAT